MNKYKKNIAISILLVFFFSTIFSPLKSIAKNIEYDVEKSLNIKGEIIEEAEEIQEENKAEQERIQQVDDNKIIEYDKEEDKQEDIEQEDIEQEDLDTNNISISRETIYVDSKAGNDNNNGSKELPYKTLEKAIILSKILNWR